MNMGTLFSISPNVTMFYFAVISASVSVILAYQEDHYLPGYLVSSLYKFKVLGGVSCKIFNSGNSYKS